MLGAHLFAQKLTLALLGKEPETTARSVTIIIQYNEGLHDWKELPFSSPVLPPPSCLCIRGQVRGLDGATTATTMFK